MLTEGCTEPGRRISAGCGRFIYMLPEHLQNLMSVTSEQRMKCILVQDDIRKRSKIHLYYFYQSEFEGS